MQFVRRLSCLALALVLIVGALPAARAESYPFIGYTTDSLRLRDGASTKAGVILTMARGSALLVTGETGDFYIVQYEGTNGYAMKSFISKMPGAAAPTESIFAPVATVPPIVTSTAYEALYNGMSGANVRAVQEALTELRFYAGAIDGKYGTGTTNAVTAFQRKNALPANGVADASMQHLLFEGRPLNTLGRTTDVSTLPPIEGVTARQGDSGELVERIQTRLREMNYYSGAIDGKYGSGTASAVRSFQRAIGLTADGIANDVTQKALFGLAVATEPPAFVPPAPTAKPVTDPVYPYVTTTAVSVNMRKGRSISAAYIQSVPKGATVTVQSMSGEYIYATYNGKSGYLNIAYVNIPPEYLGGKTLSQNADAQRDYTAIALYSSGANVKALKQALNELGYYKGTIDATCDEAASSAIKQFQRVNSLRQDGIATPEIQQLIFEKGALNASGKKTHVKTIPDIDGFSMKLNATGDRVSQLQAMLKTMGYYGGIPNGTFDRNTYQAVRDFQKAKGLTVDGVAGPKTLAVLYILSATPTPPPAIYLTPTPAATPTPLTAANVIVMQNGTRGVAVSDLQRRLVELGYYAVIPDGVYNSDDIAAVREFQRKNRLKVDGIAGLDTQLVLYSAAAVPFATPTPDVFATPTPTPTPAPVITETLRIGSYGESVRAMQARLTQLGYLTGLVDGIYGTGTANAVSRFQRASKLSVDGIAGPATLAALYAYSAQPTATAAPTATPAPDAVTTLKIGDRGDEVRRMQATLIALGYLKTADGIFGLQTYNAVKNFQTRNHLTSDGIAGKMTLTRLNSSNAIGAQVVDITPSAPSAPTGNPIVPFAAPKASEVRYANWFSEIRSRARSMPDVIIYDPISGLRYNLHMFSFGKHADCEPPTAEDTAIMEQMIGVNDWTAKFVWVIFSDGRVYIASTHSHGHEVDHTKGNDLTGHVCLHFPRIMEEAEATGPYAVSHQKAILLGWEITQAMIGQ